MDARGILTKLRKRETLEPEDIRWFADGLASGAVSDAQAGAFAMAVCQNGLTTPERVALTLAMRDSGDRMRWDLPAPAVDKHSTGGLGDCVSLPLAPALAAAGAFVPMISGRGLGHTGGTLDKLEAIPGFDVNASEERFRDLVRDIGCAIVSASGNLAPADKRLYLVRDVTSTVESIDLITASILSKKLAAGLDALVLDVKVGSGAFMETAEDAEALARSLVTTANDAGCRTTALITDMNQPLCPAVGNAVEVAESMRLLTSGDVTSPLAVLTAELSGEVLASAGLANDRDAGAAAIRAALADGRAAEIFGRMVAAMGGPSDFADNWDRHLPAAPVIRDLPAPASGQLSAIDGHAMGMAVVRLGGGRLKDGDPVDPRVGLTDVLRLGTRVGQGDPLCRIHAADAVAAEAAAAALMQVFTLSDGAPPEHPLIHRSLA
jgi:thymidine phosphorylase